MNNKYIIPITGVIVVVIMIALVFHYVGKKDVVPSFSTPQPTPVISITPSSASVKVTLSPVIMKATSSPVPWQTYTSEKDYFSIRYPQNWTAAIQPSLDQQNKTMLFSGKEGNVTVSWGTGFGGACGGEKPLEKFTIGKDVFDICHEFNNGSEIWRLISKDFGNINGVDVGVDVSAQANVPAATNRTVVLQVLQSLKFLIK